MEINQRSFDQALEIKPIPKLEGGKSESFTVHRGKDTRFDGKKFSKYAAILSANLLAISGLGLGAAALYINNEKEAIDQVTSEESKNERMTQFAAACLNTVKVEIDQATRSVMVSADCPFGGVDAKNRQSAQDDKGLLGVSRTKISVKYLKDKVAKTVADDVKVRRDNIRFGETLEDAFGASAKFSLFGLFAAVSLMGLAGNGGDKRRPRVVANGNAHKKAVNASAAKAPVKSYSPVVK